MTGQFTTPEDSNADTPYSRAPKKHISKHWDRDIPYKPAYNEAQKGKDIPKKMLMLMCFLGP